MDRTNSKAERVTGRKPWSIEKKVVSFEKGEFCIKLRNINLPAIPKPIDIAPEIAKYTPNNQPYFLIKLPITPGMDSTQLGVIFTAQLL